MAATYIHVCYRIMDPEKTTDFCHPGAPTTSRHTSSRRIPSSRYWHSVSRLLRLVCENLTGCDLGWVRQQGS
jgi:hypothetical protein